VDELIKVPAAVLQCVEAAAARGLCIVVDPRRRVVALREGDQLVQYDWNYLTRMSLWPSTWADLAARKLRR
jgi:ribosomal protein L13E